MKTTTGRAQVTIKDVAERAGVSLMTVSRVVNGQGRVKDSTRDKVEAAISALNYRPNIMARRLAGGGSLFIGIIYHNPSPGYLSKVLDGALRACRIFGHHLVIDDMGGVTPNDDNYREVAQSLHKAGLDGVIITPPLSHNRDLVDALTALKIACVRVAPGNIFTETLRVAMDDTKAVHEMIDYLITQGHTRIGFIKAPERSKTCALRYAGYLSALKDNNILPDPDLVIDGEFTYRSGMDGAYKLLSLAERPTAIFASNDDMAAGVIAAANMRGLAVPDDLSVAGFDDTEIATSIWPELTTIRQPIAQMAEQAVGLITDSLTGDSTIQDRNQALLEFDIVKRGSVKKI